MSVYFGEKDKKLRKGKLQKRDLVITTRGTVGNFVLYDKNAPFKNIRINSGMAIIRSNDSIVCSEFLLALLKSSLIQNQIKRIAFGSAQPQLTIKLINGFEITAPSLSEQKKITEILSTWDKAIEQMRKLIDAKKHRKKDLMQQLLTGKKRLPGF
jgi:type I restriction enzyme, S subunit